MAQAQTQLTLFVDPQSLSLECEHGSGARRFEAEGPSCRTKDPARTCSSANAGQCRQAASRRRCENDPQSHKEQTVEAMTMIPQERVSKRIVKQIMDKPLPQVAGAEHQGLKTTQQVVNTSVQHIKIPQVSDIPVVAPRQILPMTQTVQKTTEIPQLQFSDQVVDVPVAFVVLVPQMQVVPETVEISQLDVVEKSAETPEIQTIHGTQTSESLSTAPVRQMATVGSRGGDRDRSENHRSRVCQGASRRLSEARRPRYPNQVPRGRSTSRNTRKPFCQRIEKEGLCDGEMWKNKPPFRLALNRAASDEIAWHCMHCTERGVMKLHESGTALAEGMGVLVSKMEELITAHSQTFLKTVKDPDREPYPAYPSSNSWYKAEARQRSSEPEITVTGSVLSGKIVEVFGVTSHTTPGNTKFPLFRPCRKRWKSYRFNSLIKRMMSPSRRNDRYQRSRMYRTRKSIP